jgi:EAL domain-containing protein (putative c-di-GMP-specific phosphodiesterase class I)
VQLDARAGVAVAPVDAAGPEELYARVEAALGEACSTRRSVSFFNEKVQRRFERYDAVVKGLREALEGDQFSVMYQPVVGPGGEIAYSEALMRWSHPELGQVPPDEFIPAAESSGLIVSLTRSLMHTVLADMNRLETTGRPARMSVNVSAKHLGYESIAVRMARDTRAAGMSPSQVGIELTESALISDLSHHFGALRSFADSGFPLALDDFGTGYSSLSYLKRLPVGTLKLDRAFVWGIEEDPRGVDMVASIIRLAENLGLTVVADGVETEKQALTLAELSCNYFQGYYFHRPMAVEQLQELVNGRPSAAGNSYRSIS